MRNDPMNNPTAILDHLPAMVSMIDMETHTIRYANRHMMSIFGKIQGKTCWKVLQRGQQGPCPFCNNDQLYDKSGLPSGSARRQTINTLTRRWYDIVESATLTEGGRLVKMSVAMDITDQLHAMSAQSSGTPRPTARYSAATDLVVMCARCHKIRSPDGRWQSPSNYLRETLGISVSHGMCHDCTRQFYPGFVFDQDETNTTE